MGWITITRNLQKQKNVKNRNFIASKLEPQEINIKKYYKSISQTLHKMFLPDFFS